MRGDYYYLLKSNPVPSYWFYPVQHYPKLHFKRALNSL
ncbi:hypothetical protein SLEP1_g2435 [Rubroshorea leprosula]|uniref:Uncharacterized protein n=1 Tax=Rubroshorea leprosula TaxID=152421 RepID=A0AAV5HSK6_9ROSI|nr:hypothetical protein SLEP1_g2435 [Rubroshorea leprosula]